MRTMLDLTYLFMLNQTRNEMSKALTDMTRTELMDYINELERKLDDKYAIPQPDWIAKYMLAKHGESKKIMYPDEPPSEKGIWSGEYEMSIKDIIDFSIDWKNYNIKDENQ